MIKKQSLLLLCLATLFSIMCISWKVDCYKVPATAKKTNTINLLFEKYIEDIYQTAHLNETDLDFQIFKKGLIGFLNLKASGNLSKSNSILTIVNFNLPSNKKRMWIIDLLAKNLIMNTWVSHGQGSGKAKAIRFSDKEKSHASSLGFYLTDALELILYWKALSVQKKSFSVGKIWLLVVQIKIQFYLCWTALK